MFEKLSPAPEDAILKLMSAFEADKRANKIDLGVGVYKDATGNTPIMTAVRRAEARRVETQTSKAYVGMAGNKGFNDVMVDLVLADQVARDRVRAVQAPGGTGALRLIADLLNVAMPGATVYLSDPTWPNHVPLMQAAGLKTAWFPYFDAGRRNVRFDEMCEAVRKMTPEDILLLHGCCHNPTGANLTREQWDTLSSVIEETGVFVLVDMAYLGFGDGLQADAYGVRTLAARVSEMAIAVSCSKNFGLYRERTGCAIIVCSNDRSADVTLSQLLGAARANYSMPPDHGAEIVRIVLTDSDLRSEWETELAAVRNRMIDMRQRLAEAMRVRSNSADYDFVASHRGMFSLLGLTPEQVNRIKRDHGVYIVNNSRINIGGLNDNTVDTFADALQGVSTDAR